MGLQGKGKHNKVRKEPQSWLLVQTIRRQQLLLLFVRGSHQMRASHLFRAGMLLGMLAIVKYDSVNGDSLAAH